MGKRNKSSKDASSGGAGDDAKHEAKLQAVVLADPFCEKDTFRPISLDKRCHAAPILCPLNNVVLLDYTLDFCAGAGVEELIVVCVQEEVETHVQERWQEGGNNNSKSGSGGTPHQMQVTVVRDPSLTNAGDALRELDKRNLVQSDPFLLLRGDVVSNVDLQSVLKEHKERHKADSSAIMTLLFKPVSCWNVNDDHDSNGNTNGNNNKATFSTLRASTEDLVVGLDTSTTVPGKAPRIFVYDDRPDQASVSLPCSFLTTCPKIDFRCDLLDCGIDICSPDVLARFSDEFDYRDIRREFVANSVAEEEEGLQSKLYAHILSSQEYAARVQDWRTYGAISHDLLRRWCYPIVPDNLPSGYEKQYRYVQQHRQFVYREQKLGRTKVGRSSTIKGAGMIGSHCFIGENCTIQNTVIGHHVHIADNVTLIDCHVWDNVSIEEGVTVMQSILSYECVIKAGAKVSKGCIVGEGCIIGSNMKLPTFSRITTISKDAEEDSDDDDDAFDDDDEDEDEEEEEAAKDKGTAATTKAATKGGGEDDDDDEVETDHAIVGKDGRGRVWLPSLDDDDDSDEEDEEADQTAMLAKLNEMKSRSIGFDPTNLYRERKKHHDQAQADDGFSDDEAGDDADGGMMGMVDDDGFDSGVAFGSGAAGQSATEGGSEIPTYGRQAGVDVVKELKTICLEFEPTSPMENLAIELNSYKFSQNATYSDCAMGATLAILDLMKITKSMSDGKLVGALKSQLETWAPLLKRLCIGVEEEKAVIVALENAAIGGGEIGEKLSTGPSFRFMLQTLHDEEVISEECVLTWASERRTDANTAEEDNPRIQLFELQPVQDFLEWLEGDSSEEDGEEGSDEESEEE